MSIKITRSEKADKNFQELYKKLIEKGLKPTKALREARKEIYVPNEYR